MRSPFDVKLSNTKLTFQILQHIPEFYREKIDDVRRDPTVTRAWLRNRPWAPICMETNNARFWSSGELIIHFLRQSKRTLFDLISDDTITDYAQDGQAQCREAIDFKFAAGKMVFRTNHGDLDIKRLTLDIHFTIRRTTRADTKNKALPRTVSRLADLSSEAFTDYVLARMFGFAGSFLSARAGFFCQQACEKYIKAYTFQRCGQISYSHRLLSLAEQAASLNPLFVHPRVSNFLKIFDEFSEVGRYGPAARFDPHAKHDDTMEVRGGYMWQAAYIDELDWFVSNIRPILNRGNDDELNDVLHDRRDSMIMQTWNHDIPIRNVLMRHNRHLSGPSF